MNALHEMILAESLAAEGVSMDIFARESWTGRYLRLPGWAKKRAAVWKRMHERRHGGVGLSYSEIAVLTKAGSHTTVISAVNKLKKEDSK